MEYNRIYSAIDRLRLQMPLNSVTMDILAAKSGVSRATLYRLYGSRQAILSGYLSRSGELNHDKSTLDISDRILNAACTIFLSQGEAATTMERVARQAGVGSATVYRRFKSKENLLDQMQLLLIPQESPDLSILDDFTDLQAAFEQFTLSMLRWINQHQGVLNFRLLESETLTEMQKKIDKLRSRTRDQIINFFRDLLPNSSFLESQAQFLTVTYLGLIMAFAYSDPHINPYPFQEKQAAVWITDILLRKIEEIIK